MPSHVRIFFGLAVAVVAYWLLSETLFWVRIGLPTYLMGATSDPAIGAIMARNVQNVFLITLPYCAVTLGLAWAAAFRRQHWARVAFVAFAVLWEAAGAIEGGRSYALTYWLQARLANPIRLVPVLLMLAAAVFVFTGNARGWFAPSGMIPAEETSE